MYTAADFFPSLKALYRESRRQTPKQMIAIAEMIAAMHNATLNANK